MQGVCGIVGMPDKPPPIDTTEMRILGVLSIYGPEREMAPYAVGQGGTDMCVGCALCKYYYGGDDAVAQHMLLQHLMGAHMKTYDRAMFHFQRIRQGVGRGLTLGDAIDDAILELLINRHEVNAAASGAMEYGRFGRPRYMFVCSVIWCRYRRMGEKAECEEAMHNHMEVCHHDIYNEVRRLAVESANASAELRGKLDTGEREAGI